MTAEQIRAELKTNIAKFNQDGGTAPEVLMFLLYGMAGEVAAQLAESNALFALQLEQLRKPRTLKIDSNNPLGWAAPRMLAVIRKVYTHLNERIDSADQSSVPVFEGIADLHAIVEQFKEW